MIKENRKLYRTKADRQKDTKTTKATWFREQGATTTIKIPMTTNSGLAKQIRLILAMFPGPKGTSVKVQELPGRPIMSSLTKKNPSGSEACPRGSCPLGNQPCAGRCSEENILYKAICTRCRDDQEAKGIDPEKVVDSMYLGETARTMRVRASQHFSDYHRCARANKDPEAEDMNSFMWDHHCQAHGGGPMVSTDDYTFQVAKKFRDSMTRQQEEASRIQVALQSNIDVNHKGSRIPITSLNRKSEFFAPRKRNVFT